MLLAACAVMAGIAWVARRALHPGEDEDDAARFGGIEHLVTAVPPIG